jgi:hypothetical protein
MTSSRVGSGHGAVVRERWSGSGAVQAGERRRGAVEVALAQRAAEGGHRAGPVLGFQAFGHHGDAEFGADGQHRTAQGTGTVRGGVDVGQGGVEFDDVDGDGVQLGEGVVAAAEVVEGYPYAQGAQPFDEGGRARQVGDPQGFGDLDDQAGRTESSTPWPARRPAETLTCTSMGRP